ncbi:MAG: YtxH domain-containing protein [Candidatus Firestonebacteria bacterium]|nr:YtxH domain-containing protein [Candidatus Firestonebacteria bacterium]
MKIVLGGVIGAALGFGYYRFIGCASGSCPITSNPFISTLYGALMGVMLALP